MRTVREAERPDSLYPHYLDPSSGEWRGQGSYSLGAYADSFYEYLLKEWLRSGQTDLQSWTMFSEAAAAVSATLVQQTEDGLTYLSSVSGGRASSTMEHLACFAGGMFGLAGGRWLRLGEEITRTCHQSHLNTPTGLAPDIISFSGATGVEQEDKYILRPETAESYLVLWRMTGHSQYRDWGWQLVTALEKHCK